MQNEEGHETAWRHHCWVYNTEIELIGLHCRMLYVDKQLSVEEPSM